MTKSLIRCLLVFLFLLQGSNSAIADDSCVYAVTANNVPPNVLLLLDNGAERSHRIKMGVKRPIADDAASRMRDFKRRKARKERANQKDRRSQFSNGRCEDL